MAAQSKYGVTQCGRWCTCAKELHAEGNCSLSLTRLACIEYMDAFLEIVCDELMFLSKMLQEIPCWESAQVINWASAAESRKPRLFCYKLSRDRAPAGSTVLTLRYAAKSHSNLFHDTAQTAGWDIPTFSRTLQTHASHGTKPTSIFTDRASPHNKSTMLHLKCFGRCSILELLTSDEWEQEKREYTEKSLELP